MHIAYYAPAWPPAGAANGIVTYVAAMRRHLLAQGHEVSVLANGTLFTADGRERSLEPVQRRRAGWWSRFQQRLDRDRGDHPLTARRLADQFRAARLLARFDLVEMEESFGWSGIAERELSVPVVTRLHGPQCLKPAGEVAGVEARRSRQRAVAEGHAIRGAAALTAPTTKTLHEALAHYGAGEGMTAVIPNPVEPSDPDHRWRADDHDRSTLLYVGRFDHAKGADTVLDAFVRLAEVRRGVHLLMVGPDAGIAGPGGEVLRFAEYAKRHVPAEIRARIEFTGILPPERIAVLRRRAALTVVTSRFENFPYAAIEAMAVGSPLVSTAWAGSDEVIEHGRTGWLTPVADPERLATRLLWLLDHPAAAAAAGEAAWHYCRRHFAPPTVGTRAVAFYQEVLSRHVAT